ncbi:MAG: hypothetical protein NTZ49_01405 [Candidatus Parcubacteria bacterium]|nr:hypothetical protein [Candidatus Parcubacteria bacterium]
MAKKPANGPGALKKRQTGKNRQNARNSPFGSWIKIGGKLTFVLHDEEVIINNLRKIGYTIT